VHRTERPVPILLVKSIIFVVLACPDSGADRLGPILPFLIQFRTSGVKHGVCGGCCGFLGAACCSVRKPKPSKGRERGR